MSKLTQQTTQIVLPRNLNGKTVKAWRTEKKMSADNLAQRLGCSRSYVKHIEGGSLAASQKFIAKFNALRAELNGHEPEPEPVRPRTVKSAFELPKSFEILARAVRCKGCRKWFIPVTPNQKMHTRAACRRLARRRDRTKRGRRK